MIWGLTCAIAWISAACAACYGMYITKSFLCLLVFLFPVITMPTQIEMDNKENESKSNKTVEVVEKNNKEGEE